MSMDWEDYDKRRDFEQLKGKTLVEVSHTTQYDDEIVFKTDDGETYKMGHIQDCCEHVVIEEIIGDLQDLIGDEIR